MLIYLKQSVHDPLGYLLDVLGCVGFGEALKGLDGLQLELEVVDGEIVD